MFKTPALLEKRLDKSEKKFYLGFSNIINCIMIFIMQCLSVAKYQFSDNNYNFEEARRALVRFVSTLLTL